MSLRLRASAWAVLGAGSIVLAACGTEGDDARTPLEPVQATSYVTIEPATTTTTIAAANTTVPPEGATDPNEQVYLIQAGDSVSRIASIHGITMEQLVTYNQWTDGINHVLIPGVEVRIPPNSKVPGTGSASGATTGTTPPASGGTTPPATETAGEGCTHTIVEGDNPTRVSNKYDISVQVLEQANAGNPAYQSFPIGGTLNIPAGADCP
jgi:LysM repeat protein